MPVVWLFGNKTIISKCIYKYLLDVEADISFTSHNREIKLENGAPKLVQTLM